ncbi:MAG: CPBP family intramembrane metalloprotease [Treponema sp.]|nr:CPBP family intramembrane metalloprotease [Treponema sp.]
MGISLSLFLDVLLLLVVLFPCALMYLNKKSVQEFGKAFFSSFLFVSVYLFFTVEWLWNIFKFNYPIYKFLLLGILCTALSLSLECGIAKIKFNEIKVMNLKSDNIFIYSMVLVFIPVVEEIFFVGYLNIICERLQIGSLFFVLFSGFSFGINHIIYSRLNVLTKTVWGIIFAIFYLLTRNLYIVIFSHILNNLILFLIGKRTKR